MDQHSRDNITRNLRRLVADHGNIADLCRRLKINRQQFNKYLSGQHLPSRPNLNAICAYFGLEYAEIVADDLKLSERKAAATDLVGLEAFSKADLLQTVLRSSENEKIEKLAGCYFKYHLSSIYRGDIVRAVTYIYPLHGLYGYSNLERFPAKDEPNKHGYIFKYHGFVFMLDGRLFMADLEKMQCNEITFSIYTPIARNPVRFLFGVTSGVASNLYREPYSSRSVLEFKGRGPLSRDLLRKAIVLVPDDPAIPVEAIEYLDP